MPTTRCAIQTIRQQTIMACFDWPPTLHILNLIDIRRIDCRTKTELTNELRLARSKTLGAGTIFLTTVGTNSAARALVTSCGISFPRAAASCNQRVRHEIL